MDLYSVFKSPVITEKSNTLREKDGKYTFVVHNDANKTVIKKAMKKVFDVDAVSVNSCIRRGKL